MRPILTKLEICFRAFMQVLILADLSNNQHIKETSYCLEGENRQNLHVFNLWPVIYHTEKNSCANPTPETLSVEIYTSQRDYPKSTHFYFVAIDISQQKTVPV